MSLKKMFVNTMNTSEIFIDYLPTLQNVELTQERKEFTKHKGNAV